MAAEALQDADDAAAWYHSRREGLGREFLEEFDRTIQRIRDNVLAFPSLEFPEDAGEHVRRALMHRFPYVVNFAIHDEDGTVVAVEHASRQPGRWLDRLPGE